MKTYQVTINGNQVAVTHAGFYRSICGEFTNYDFHLYTKDGHTMTGIVVDSEHRAKHCCRHTGIKNGETVTVGQDFMDFAEVCDRQTKAISEFIRGSGKRIRQECGDDAMVAAAQNIRLVS